MINTNLTPRKDLSRAFHQGPPSYRSYDNRYDRDWDRGQDRQYDRGSGSRRGSSPSPRRGRRTYRDRDHEGYRSPGYDSPSRSYSRSRSRSRSRYSREDRRRWFAAPPNKEIMLEGLAPDMTEEDVRSSFPSSLPQTVRCGRE
jgi:hypothetical protein